MGKGIKRRWLGPLAFALLAGGAGSAIADDPVDLGSPIILVDGTTVTTTGGADGVGYDEVLEEGAGLPKQAQVNFIGAAMTCVNDAGNTRTNCTIVSASPGGADKQVQFNDAGAFGGDADLTWDKTANDLGIGDCAFTTPAANVISITCNGVEVARFNTAASGVNYVDMTPAATGSGPTIAAAGSDTDVDLHLDGQGSGDVRVDSDTVWLISPGQLWFGTSSVAGIRGVHGVGGSTAIHAGGASRFQVTVGQATLADDVLIARDVNAGLTACTTQTQGQCPLTAEINQISTTDNPNDVCGTLMPAVAGLKIIIVNNGANDCQVFPASGDDIGAGVDAALSLPADHVSVCVAYDDTNWSATGEPGVPHGTMLDEDNTDVFVVSDAGLDFHSYHTNALALGQSHGWTFDAGGGGTSFPIASVANSVGSPGTQILVTTTGSHLLAAGDIISQTNLADAAYVGVFEVVVTAAPTTYEVAAVFTATGTGTMDQAATMECTAGLSDDYHISWHATATSAVNNETFDFVLYRETTTIPGSKVRRKFGTAADFGSFSAGGVVAVTCGDKISLALSNEDSAGNITIRNVTIVATRL